MSLEVDKKFLKSIPIDSMNQDELWQAVLYAIKPAYLVIRYDEEGNLVYGYSESPWPDSWLSGNMSARLSANTGFIFKMLEQFDKSQISQIEKDIWELKVWFKEEYQTELVELSIQGSVLPTLIMKLWLQAQFGESMTVPIDLSEKLWKKYAGWQVYPVLGDSEDRYSDESDEFEHETEWKERAILLNHYQQYRDGRVY
jgi:hypothetical protein